MDRNRPELGFHNSAKRQNRDCGEHKFGKRTGRSSVEISVLMNMRKASKPKVMYRQSVFASAILLTAGIGVGLGASSWQKKDDPSQWTTEDVYQILNNSPWSKSVSVTSAPANSGYGNPGGHGGMGGPWGEQMPGGMGRGGWGGGGMGRGRRSGYPTGEQAATVTVQWQSALPVRIAEAKTSRGAIDPSAIKPLDEYLIAVIGLPKSGFRPQASTDNSGDAPDDATLADHLKVITVLSFGQERLNPTKVELNQGRDARTIFHFEKSEPITLRDKDVEFRITGKRTELKKKFSLKDMEYRGQLEL